MSLIYKIKVMKNGFAVFASLWGGGWALGLNSLIPSDDVFSADGAAIKGCVARLTGPSISAVPTGAELASVATMARTQPGVGKRKRTLTTGCEDCSLTQVNTQTYCESRESSDCDGTWGWNESYAWKREERLYQCPPNNGWFVTCGLWQVDGCCNNGTPGLPPSTCAHQGAGACSLRNPG